MNIPENIVKMLSSGIPDTIRLGLFLAIDYFDDSKEYTEYLSKLCTTLESKKSHELGINCVWANYYRENKQYGKNSQTTTIS